MRQWAWIPFLCWMLGCANTDALRGTSCSRSMRPNTVSSDHVQVDVAFIEMPIGDRFINEEIWQHVDEQVVRMDQLALLDQNGLRVGQMIGLPPERFHTLLTSERNCVNPRRRFLPVGKRRLQRLTRKPHSQCTFKAIEQEEPIEITLAQVDFVFEIQASLADEGRTRLRFTPKAEYGEPVPDYHATSHGFEMDFRKRHKTFDESSWQVELSPNEYLIIGGHFGRPDSFGYKAFVSEQRKNPTQRLMVIRTSRLDNHPEAVSPEDLQALSQEGASLPLALQASMTTVRAQR